MTQAIDPTSNTKQKEDLINRDTDAVDAVEGEGARPVTWVIVEDVLSGTWGGWRTADHNRGL